VNSDDQRAESRNPVKSGWRKRMTRRPGIRVGYGTLAVAGALIAIGAIPGTASAQTNDRVWAGCTLNTQGGDDEHPTTTARLLEDMAASSSDLLPDQIAFVVIHSFQENNGQPIDGGGFTGPVICRAPDVDMVEVEQTALIGSNNARVDLLDQQGGMSVLYRDPAGSADPADNRKRFCWTVASAADCFDFARTP
jgi:hypothetical protein